MGAIRLITYSAFSGCLGHLRIIVCFANKKMKILYQHKLLFIQLLVVIIVVQIQTKEPLVMKSESNEEVPNTAVP